jgi:hypothetical protein
MRVRTASSRSGRVSDMGKSGMFYTLAAGNRPEGPVAVGKDLRSLENYLLILPSSARTDN